jgi:sialate O-acetylesterase
LIPYGIRGAIWYQGESNANRAYQYRDLFKTMIKNWRDDWKQGAFPFYFVQLANFMPLATTPVDDEWAELREAQTMALSLRNTGMAVAIDIGDAGNIHPRDKQTVGDRLAVNALAKLYGFQVEYSGPMYSNASFKGGEARVSFSHADGLTSKGGAPIGFAVAGADHKFYWADAKIDGTTVVLTCAQVPQPVAVRYGWSSNPPANLYNSAGLPASPFRTDNWKGITEGAK